MSKKIIIGVLAFILLAGGVGVGVYLVQRNQNIQEQASPASTLKLTPASKSKFIGESVTVTVDIDTTTNIAAFATVDVTFDATKLTLQELTPTTALPVVLTPASIDNTAGTASISLGAQPANPFQGKGAIATLKFAAKTAGQAQIAFGTQTKAYGSTAGINEGRTDILVSKSPTTITVLTQGETTPSPSASPSVQASASPLASSSPLASTTPVPTPTPPAGGTSASATPTASATPSSSSKPTVTLPTSGKVVAGSTISGTAAPNSTVTIVIKSQTITTTVKADAAGKWSYKIPADLENGSHTITITDSNGTVTKSFVVTGSTATGSATTSTASAVPATGNEMPTIIAAFAGIVLLFIGIAIAL